MVGNFLNNNCQSFRGRKKNLIIEINIPHELSELGLYIFSTFSISCTEAILYYLTRLLIFFKVS